MESFQDGNGWMLVHACLLFSTQFHRTGNSFPLGFGLQGVNSNSNATAYYFSPIFCCTTMYSVLLMVSDHAPAINIRILPGTKVFNKDVHNDAGYSFPFNFTPRCRNQSPVRTCFAIPGFIFTFSWSNELMKYDGGKIMAWFVLSSLATTILSILFAAYCGSFRL